VHVFCHGSFLAIGLGSVWALLNRGSYISSKRKLLFIFILGFVLGTGGKLLLADGRFRLEISILFFSLTVHPIFSV
jgi:hypothetical protein